MIFSCKKFADSEKLPTFASGNIKRREKNKGSDLAVRILLFFVLCAGDGSLVLYPPLLAHI